MVEFDAKQCDTCPLRESPWARVKVTLPQGQLVLVVVDGMARDDFEAPIRYTLRIQEYVPAEPGR